MVDCNEKSKVMICNYRKCLRNGIPFHRTDHFRDQMRSKNELHGRIQVFHQENTHWAENNHVAHLRRTHLDFGHNADDLSAVEIPRQEVSNHTGGKGCECDLAEQPDPMTLTNSRRTLQESPKVSRVWQVMLSSIVAVPQVFGPVANVSTLYTITVMAKSGHKVSGRLTSCLSFLSTITVTGNGHRRCENAMVWFLELTRRSGVLFSDSKRVTGY
jgi:hypothetical protein